MKAADRACPGPQKPGDHIIGTTHTYRIGYNTALAHKTVRTVASASDSSAPQRFLSPRYLPTWLALVTMWLLAQLPFRIQMLIGALLGNTMRYLAPRRRQIAETNLKLCFPDLGEAERKALLKAHFRSLGIGSVETAMSWWTPETRLKRRVRIEGLENLTRALEQGKGVILMSGHFTSLEIGGRLLAMFAPFHVLYRKHKNPLFESTMKQARERHFDKAIPRDDMRGMIRSLKDNMPVWYAPDQDYGREKSVFAPFFGIPAATITATSRLAKSSGAAVVPFFQRRLPDGSGYALRLYPALEGFPSDDLQEDARRVNQIIEEQIRSMPEQYLWVHRRFKTRPEGAPALYTGKGTER